MQLTSRKLAFALSLVLSTGSCADDFVSIDGDDGDQGEDDTEDEVDERLLGDFSAPYTNTSDPTYVTRVHIEPNGAVLWVSQSGCGESVVEKEREYVWRSDGPDTIVITDPTSDNIQGASEIRVSHGLTCNQIRVAHLRTSGTELYDYQMFRGELCLYSTTFCGGHGCSGCVIDWCDGSSGGPGACE
jgi:hypothetical protein